MTFCLSFFLLLFLPIFPYHLNGGFFQAIKYINWVDNHQMIITAKYQLSSAFSSACDFKSLFFCKQ